MTDSTYKSIVLSADDEEILSLLSRHCDPSTLDLISKRVRAGHVTYGPLSLQSDRRNMRREAIEELADAAYYLAAEYKRTNRMRDIWRVKTVLDTIEGIELDGRCFP